MKMIVPNLASFEVAFVRPPEVKEALVDGRRDLTIAGITPKSTISIAKKMEKDGDKDKETLTFTDPFGGSNPLVPVNLPKIP